MNSNFLQRVFVKPDVRLDHCEFPGSLPFVRELNIEFSQPVTFFVGENGCGKSTVLEAIAELAGLPAGGGGKNEAADSRAPQNRSELAPYIRGSFRKKPSNGYFFRAEFQAHFASLLDARRDDPDFMGNPYARYGGKSLFKQSHGESFLAVFSAWMGPGLILMDEPEAALSPQRQLAVLSQMSKLAKDGGVQFIVATHSPILLTFPHASILAFDGERITETNLRDTSHYQITKSILDAPERYWRHLAMDNGDE